MKRTSCWPALTCCALAVALSLATTGATAASLSAPVRLPTGCSRVEAGPAAHAWLPCVSARRASVYPVEGTGRLRGPLVVAGARAQQGDPRPTLDVSADPEVGAWLDDRTGLIGRISGAGVLRTRRLPGVVGRENSGAGLGDARILASTGQRAWVVVVKASERRTGTALLVDERLRVGATATLAGFRPGSAAVAPDGALWIVAETTSGNDVVRVDLSGVQTRVAANEAVAVAGFDSSGSALVSARGANGKAWFIRAGAAAAPVSLPAVATHGDDLGEPAAGADGSVWFRVSDGLAQHTIYAVSAAGELASRSLPGDYRGDDPFPLDGSVWVRASRATNEDGPARLFRLTGARRDVSLGPLRDVAVEPRTATSLWLTGLRGGRFYLQLLRL